MSCISNSNARRKSYDLSNKLIKTKPKKVSKKEINSDWRKLPKLNIRKVARPSKNELEKLIWEKPTIQLALDFGVSDKAIEKWCKSYGIKKPERGYWAKLAVGKN